MPDSNGLSSKQERIYQWVNEELQLPVYADTFKGASLLFNQKSPGYMPFVAHAGREIMNGLARAYRGDESRQVQYVKHINEIAPMWDDRWGGPIGLTDSEEPPHHEIPRAICEMLKSLIDEHKEGRARNQETNEIFFSTFFDYDNRGNIPENFVREWKSARNWFSGRAHISENAFNSEIEPKLAKHFQTLETNLFAAASSQYERIRGLDEILEETN